MSSARGFFRAAIFRDPDSPSWGWALEWNGNYRVLGFFGTEAERHAQRIPALSVSKIPLAADAGELHVGEEQALPEDVDYLFKVPDKSAR